ncbi:MAG: TerD family protein [Bacteroidales bacterium]|nr:TerD family protein [Bacteroidales bacterium]
MARFDLNKGERFQLKKSEGLSKIQINLGWKSGADLDACAFLLGVDGVITDDADFVFYNSGNRCNPESLVLEPFDKAKFGNKKNWRSETIPISKDGSVVGSADDLGDGDDDGGEDAGEEMHVILDKVNPQITEIVFCVTIYHGDEDGTTFGKVREPFISVVNEENDEELCRYNLKEKFANETAVVAGSLICDEEGEWSFEAVGKGYEGGMQTLIDIYA